MKPYLFLHIPRTGGTSIANILPAGRTTDVKINKLISDGKRINMDSTSKHGTNKGVSFQHAILDEYQVSKSELFTFTFVRNPWDRMVSIFEHQINNCGLGFATGDDKITKFRTFISLVKWLWEQDLLKYELDGHLRPQTFYTHKNGEQIIDFYGRYENMAEDLKTLSEICEFNLKNVDIPSINKSNDRFSEYKNYYSIGNGVMKSIVNELYREEIEFFGYEF
tara:strand:+ start:481 stop:1146 length:666 start_codon:yes stop_codon:yes gene_type:complete